MTTKQQDKQQAVQEKPERRQQDVIIGNRVLHALGQPRDLYRVQVRPLWGDHYRVNVFLGENATSARVVHSYFLAADGEGNISACNPTITKQY